MATYYWVGGAGTWNSALTTNWASSSGGAGGAGIPTATDDVIFDTSSGTGTISITANSAICNNFTITATQALTFSGTVSNVKGSFSIVSGGSTVTTGLSVTFTATTSGNTVTTNGHSISGITFNGAGGAWTLGSALTLSGVFTWTNGTFNTGNYNITSSNNIRYLGTGTATINLGSSTVTTSGFNVMWDFTTTTGLTFNAGTSTIVFNSNNIKTFAGGGLTYYNVQFTGNATNTINNIQGANTFNNLLLTGPNTGGAITFTVNSNQIINGTLTANGVGYSNRLFIKSTTIGTRYTITSAVVSMSYIDFSDIAGAGTGVWAGTSIGDAKNNTGITFDTPKTVYWNLAGAQNWNAIGWSLTSGGTPLAANFPLAQDTAIFDNTGSVTGTITLSTFWNIGTVNMSARTSAMTLAVSGSFSIYGDWTNGSGTTLSGTGTITFANRSSQTITSNGKTFTQNIIVDSGTGTVSLADALTTSRPFILNSGTLNLNGYNCVNQSFTLTTGTLNLANATLTIGQWSSGISTTRQIQFGSGNITVIGAGGSMFLFSAEGFTYTGTPTINISNNSATAATFNMTGATNTNALNFNFTTGTYALTFSSGATVKNLDFTGFAGTVNNAIRTIYGNLTIPASGMTSTGGTSATTFAATSGTQVITTNGVTLDFPIIQNGVGGTFQLAGDLTLGSTRTLTLTNGTFDANNKNVSVGLFSSANSNTRTLLMGSGAWTLSGTGTVWNTDIANNLTVTGTGTISLTSASAKTFAGGGIQTYPTINQGGAGALTIQGSNKFANITNTYAATGATSVLFTGGTTNIFTAFNLTGQATRVCTLGSTTTSQATLQKGSSWLMGANSTDGGNNTGLSFTAGGGIDYLSVSYINGTVVAPPSASNGNYFLLFA